MKPLYFIYTALILLIFSCTSKTPEKSISTNNDFSALLDKYYQERIVLIPLEATQNGDTLNNDKLYADFTDSYYEKLKTFLKKYQTDLSLFKRESLSENDAISYDVLEHEIDITLKGLAQQYFTNNVINPQHQYMPFSQFGGVPLWLGQLGSGTGSQPFKTVKDYNNWISRGTAFTAWADSSIIYFKKGMEANIVLPKALVEKMIPQMEAFVVEDATASLFYGPIKTLPTGFNETEKTQLKEAYSKLITEQLVPSYKKLAVFLKNEYLPKARLTTGINALSKGSDYYNYLIKYYTTTNKTPDEIYATGLAEVSRIKGLMDSVKNAVKFNGDLKSFFTYMKTDTQFAPFKTPEEVLSAYRAVQIRIEPNLKRMFSNVPKSKFEVRQTEAFRAASASAEYNPGSPDGVRPGIFYVPILDAKKFNVTSGIEGLFLHEAIPGHHYQISLQMENQTLPQFRRFAFYGAYVEGWGLYSESLGKELGVYTDPFQYMGALGKEMHRSVRLVVDVAMHNKTMTREEAIAYMMENLPISEAGATAEIERYMAIPGQALGYKIGSIFLKTIRAEKEKEMGTKFSLSNFHDAVLGSGSLPLDVLKNKLDSWAKK